jgi:hypothetical protein
MGHILENRPPQEGPGRDVADVLEVQQSLVLERGVVRRRDVPDEVREQPEGEGERGPGELSRAPDLADSYREGGRKAEDEQRGRPLGQYDVLEEMRRKQVVGECVERGDRGGEKQRTTGAESCESPALGTVVADDEYVGEGERNNGERGLGMEGPGVRIRAGDAATLSAKHAGVAQW